jgi:four helix bundle protein
MATFSRFEDLNVWQAARVLSQDIFLITKSDAFSKDYDLKRQILRSSGSVMDNIAEGFEREGKNEFIQFLSISKASCGETRSQLYRALDFNYIKETEFNSLKEQCESLSKELSGFINYLKKSDHRGKKFDRA